MTRLPSFEEFFEAAHDVEPFPWQSRLVGEVLAHGWPDLLDLPTGAGKTSALDVALYCLASAPDRLPRRTVLVIDRRIVVDQGADHARGLLRRMRTAATGPLKAVSDALRALAWRSKPADDPFAVSVMRGGMPRDEDWAKRPDEPVLGVSTVDQLGSRLLFRGYGVSKKSASIHAGLTGNDTLILLDEVHLALPFEQTLSAICTRFRTPARLPSRFGVVRMSATAGSRNPEWRVFTMQDDDRKHPVLSKRLTASKLARLVPVKVKGDEQDRRKLLAKAAIDHALDFLKNRRIVVIVVNRIDTARLVHRLLTEQHAGETDAELVTGRMRPIDRDHFVRTVLASRVGPRNARPTDGKPLILVATQCIEAGADLDFDGLVTECASLDALKQRFGRLDRQGSLGKTHAVILGRSDATGANADPDPIYGSALSATWRWLETIARDSVVDFGISDLPPCVSETHEPRLDVLARNANGPVLLPVHLDAWAQTSAVPAHDPDVDLWLHGPDRSAPDVQVVWRSELQLPASDAAESDIANLEEEVIGALSARRPSSLEAIPIPLAAARRWLAGEGTPSIADVTSNAPQENDSRRRRDAGPVGGQPFVAFRWNGDESGFVRAGDIRPGDALVVPTSRGGITSDTFDPAGTEPVMDVADLGQLRARHIASLLLEADALKVWSLPADVDEAPRPVEDEAAAETRSRINEWVGQWPIEKPARCSATDAEWKALRTALSQGRRVRVQEQGRALIASTKVRKAELGLPEITESLTEDDDSSFRQKEITLTRHSRDVREFCEGFARTVGLDADLVGDLGMAAWLHDVGKADRRFQTWLVGGSEVRATLLREPLAKSALPAGSNRERQLARASAGYPAKYRHELLSLSMIEQSAEVARQIVDRDLVLHLVASHHGWCRPFAPPLDHPEDFVVQLNHDGLKLEGRVRHLKSRLDSGVGERFWQLVDKYGWWGLAWLEAILRLADHRASEFEAEDSA